LRIGPKWYAPPACAKIIPTGSIEAAMNPATSIFQGEAGMSAANMRMTGAVQVIIGRVSTGVPAGGPRWIMSPIPAAHTTM
jgi:hypothetical protein